MEKIDFEMDPGLLSPYGESVANILFGVFPAAANIEGPSGIGKTELLKFVVGCLDLDFTQVNFYQGTDVEYLVGQNRPINGPDGNIILQWQDGMLTRAIREGHMFAAEELNRASGEILSRLFGVLDTKDRYWSTPEAVGGEPFVDVHPNFWFVGSGNPTGGGYQTRKLDPAFMRRFRVVIKITEPLADEDKVLFRELPDSTYSEVRSRLVKWARAVRETVYVSTGDLVHIAANIGSGMTPRLALHYAVLNKLDPAVAEGVSETFHIVEAGSTVNLRDTLDSVSSKTHEVK